MPTPFPLTCALIKAIGLNSDYISTYNLSVVGYDQFVMVDGKRVMGPDGNPVIVRREWPTLQDGFRVWRQYRLEGGIDL